jgi:hypothetical protein
MTDRALNEPAEIPAELDRWNWGAFFLNWIWGIGNSTWIALLALVPFVGLFMMIVLGLRGSRWAWRNRAWRDAEHFRKTQRAWAIAGLAIWLAVIGAATALVVSIPTAMKNSEAYAMTMEAVRASPEVLEALGNDVDSGFWVGGSLNIQAGGTGEARLSIPLSGSKASGTAVSHAIRFGGRWSMRLIVVTVEGSETPIVLLNEDGVAVPGAPTEL